MDVLIDQGDSSYYKRSHTTVFVENSVRVKVPAEDTLIHLDDAALAIWDALEYPVTIPEIAAAICAFRIP